MPAYLIADIEVTDPEGYRGYAEEAPAVVAAHGGRYLARGGATEVLEGSWEPDRLVILEFPDLAAARAFYEDPEYERIKPLRHDNARSRLLITEGLTS